MRKHFPLFIIALAIVILVWSMIPSHAPVADAFWRRKITTLIDAQIKALPGTPVQVVPAPGSGFRTKILGVSLIIDSSAGAYTGISATYAAIALDVRTGNTTIYPILLTDNSTTPAMNQFSQALSVTGSRVVDAIVPASGAVPVAASVGYIVTNGATVYAGLDISQWGDKAIDISMDNNGSPTSLGGGNGNNTMKVIVYYVVEPL